MSRGATWLRRLLELVLAATLSTTARSAGAQAVPDALARERAEFAQWLASAPTSPYRAVVQQPIGPGITIGSTSADIVLAGVSARVTQRSASLEITTNGSSRPLPRDRAVPLGGYLLVAAGLPGQAVLTVFGPEPKGARTPEYYRYGSPWRQVVKLEPVARSVTQRMLSAEGVEVEATEAGVVTASAGGSSVALRVFRIPAPGGEESELEVYFRDGTNGKGTYPAGRFVNLVPLPDGRFVLDFNRARNPFCAYSTVYPCPAPWRGNTVGVPIEAGEKYLGGGLIPPPSP